MILVLHTQVSTMRAVDMRMIGMRFVCHNSSSKVYQRPICNILHLWRCRCHT
jgi:hypothetical protein